ncbi:hypothetical protein KFE25_000986 [Diacronema lutheri]|uniref:Uncharacterized protein n=1 Tax=Diacronema lutheri TaxID=2081491 RepID=A0A8J5XAK0_DIALT|nr:hypothetical protein KFE25_000986 [Diacronema lutheri]
MDVRSVHNLLRETYHSVALLDTDVCGIEDASHAPRLLAGLRAAVARPAVRLGGVGASFSSAAAAAAAAADVWSSSARARPYLATLARSAPVIDLLHADRLRSADGAASHALVTELLGASIVEARVRQTRLAVRIVALTVPVCAGTLALYLSTFVGQDVTRPDLAKLHSHGAARHAQAFLANLGMSMGTILVLLCLHPSAEQRARILAAGALGHAAIVVSTLPYAGMLLRLAPCLASRCAPVDNLADARLALTVAAAAHVTTSACNCARGVAVLWRRRFDPPRLLARLWRSLLVQLANGAVAHFIVFAAIAASGAYTPAAGDGFERVLAGAVAAASIPAHASLPRSRARTR